jgi:hypothetical protein
MRYYSFKTHRLEGLASAYQVYCDTRWACKYNIGGKKTISALQLHLSTKAEEPDALELEDGPQARHYCGWSTHSINQYNQLFDQIEKEWNTPRGQRFEQELPSLQRIRIPYQYLRPDLKETLMCCWTRHHTGLPLRTPPLGSGDLWFHCMGCLPCSMRRPNY